MAVYIHFLFSHQDTIFCRDSDSMFVMMISLHLFFEGRSPPSPPPPPPPNNSLFTHIASKSISDINYIAFNDSMDFIPVGVTLHAPFVYCLHYSICDPYCMQACSLKSTTIPCLEPQLQFLGVYDVAAVGFWSGHFARPYIFWHQRFSPHAPYTNHWPSNYEQISLVRSGWAIQYSLQKI